MINLRNLKNEELLVKTKTLVANEREILADVLHHIKEIDRRRLYLECGYSSLWAYMTVELKYSEAAAQRRIEAMRALRELPVIENKIASGALSISNVAKVQTVLKRVKKKKGAVSSSEKLKLFEELEHKSQKEADLFLATQFPKEIKKPDSIKPISATESEMRITISRDLAEKLERVRDLISHQKPNASMAEVIEVMADLVIRKKDLSVKSSVKAKPSVSRATETQERSLGLPSRGGTAAATPKVSQPPQRRYGRTAISAGVRREVWRKAQAQCEFTDRRNLGRRCQSRYQLEIEHVKPVAFGGDNEVANLRLYCRQHNRHEARNATLL